MMVVDLEGGNPGYDAEPGKNYDGPWQHCPSCSITGISIYPSQWEIYRRFFTLGVKKILKSQRSGFTVFALIQDF